MLSRYRGIPTNAWLEEVISNLEYRFGVKANSENLIAFEQNDMLKGLDHLAGIIDATTNHQTLEIAYQSYWGEKRNIVVYPYYVKQYNGRWFLFGQKDRRCIKHIGAQQFGMKFLLRGLYAHNGLLYFHTRMENGTNMPYSVDFITFKVVDKKMAKRTAIQEQVLQPLRAYHQVMQVRGMSSEHTVFALEQFSLAEDKQLEVTLYERNGGRTLTFYVTAEDLQIAKKIDNLKLKW